MRYKKIVILFILQIWYISGLTANKTHDRWLEVDLNWFHPDKITEQSKLFIETYRPLLNNNDADNGVLICPNWLIDFITEYKGDLDQKLPFKESIFKQWNQRTYRDFANLVAALKSEAEKAGLKHFHVGVFMVAWPDMIVPGIYDMRGEWKIRHPEASKDNTTIPHALLKADNYPYASMPGGISKEFPFARFFGQQWGAVSKATGLDVINLRDSFSGAQCYARKGIFGVNSSVDPKENQQWIDGYISLFREVKLGNPNAIVMGYSSAASAVGEFRVNTFDLEKLVADGYIDVFISQSWAGAWQDWWKHDVLGWTFQLSYILAHKTMIAAGNAHRSKPCKHLVLIGVMDGWEPWDIIHSVPGKLAWSIWAYNLASVKTPKGLVASDGNYISWANNQYGHLMSREDISFLVQHFNAAEKCATELQNVYGTSFVYNRGMMDWLQNNSPESNNSEWIDEQSAMLMKWGMPVLSATRNEWLPEFKNENASWLLQLPGHLKQNELEAITAIAKRNNPICLIGRSDRIDKSLLSLAGVETTDSLIHFEDLECYSTQEYPGLLNRSIVVLPNHYKIKLKSAQKLVYTPISPILTKQPEKNFFYWQPPDWRNPDESTLDRNQFGSETPYVILNKEWIDACKEQNLTYIEPVPSMLPVTFHYWKSGGKNYILFGNLETRTIGDSRLPRKVTLHIDRNELNLNNKTLLKDVFSQTQILPVSEKDGKVVFNIEIGPDGFALFTILSQ